MSWLVFLLVYAVSCYLSYRGVKMYTLRRLKEANTNRHVSNGDWAFMMIASFTPILNTVWALVICDEWWPEDSRFSKWYVSKKEIK